MVSPIKKRKMSENNVPYLRNVNLNADVYAVCLQHAFSTEKEEVMGLLIGEVDEDNLTSNISACVILHRSDKQPDRVEISPEQLCNAFTYAEGLADKLKRRMRVVGWYHSHPHITVWPSHVDVRTQATYQMMDPFFVGLIFSVFAADAGSTLNKVEVTCFQALSSGTNPLRRDIPLTIRASALEAYNLEAITDLPRILAQEVQVHCNETTDEKEDEFAELHNNALKTVQLSHIVSNITKLMTEDFLEARLKATETRIKALTALKEQLLRESAQI